MRYLVCLLALLGGANGFIIPSPSSLVQLTKGSAHVQRGGRSSVRMMMAPSDLAHHFDPVWLSHVLQGVADAAAPVVEAAEEVQKDPSWFDQFINLVQTCVKSLHNVLKDAGVPYSYGFAIVLFTTGLKLALLPVTYKQLESSQRMQALAPKAKELKEKYGKNKQLLNQLTAKLYQDAEVNPLAGCLPALAQIPIFIGLYRSLINLATDSDFNEPFLWLPSLAGPLYGQQRGTAWLTQNWIDGHPSLGWADTIAFLTIPAILIVTQTISQKMLSPPTADNDPQAQRTQQILKYLPFMVGYFSLSVPAGLGVYWITNNLVSTGISLAIKEKFKREPITIDVDVDPEALGYDPSANHMSFEDMLAEARMHSLPSRQKKRFAPRPSERARQVEVLGGEPEYGVIRAVSSRVVAQDVVDEKRKVKEPAEV